MGNYCILLMVICLLGFSCFLHLYIDFCIFGGTLTSSRLYWLVSVWKDLPLQEDVRALAGYGAPVPVPDRGHMCSLYVVMSAQDVLMKFVGILSSKHCGCLQ